jgi:hypothetical protein
MELAKDDNIDGEEGALEQTTLSKFDRLKGFMHSLISGGTERPLYAGPAHDSLTSPEQPCPWPFGRAPIEEQILISYNEGYTTDNK